MTQLLPDAPPADLLTSLVTSLTAPYTEAIVLGGSAAEGTATPYSDLDLAHIVDADYRGPEKHFHYRGSLLVSVNARTLAWWRQAVTQPERAIFVVQPMRKAHILFDPHGAFARWQTSLAACSWEPLQPAADRFAGATLAAQAETVHKLLSGLVRGKGLYEPTVTLTLEMTHAMAVHLGVLVESSASYMDQVRAAAGNASAWSAHHCVATCQPSHNKSSPDLRRQARAALGLYRETFRLIENKMLPDRRALTQATVAIVDEAAAHIL